MQQNCLLLSGNTVVLRMLQDSHHHKIQVVFQSVTMHMSMQETHHRNWYIYFKVKVIYNSDLELICESTRFRGD